MLRFLFYQNDFVKIVGMKGKISLVMASSNTVADDQTGIFKSRNVVQLHRCFPLLGHPTTEVDFLQY